MIDNLEDKTQSNPLMQSAMASIAKATLCININKTCSLIQLSYSVALRPSGHQTGMYGLRPEKTSDEPLVKRGNKIQQTTNNRGLSIESGLFTGSYCPHDRFYIFLYSYLSM